MFPPQSYRSLDRTATFKHPREDEDTTAALQSFRSRPYLPGRIANRPGAELNVLHAITPRRTRRSLTVLAPLRGLADQAIALIAAWSVHQYPGRRRALAELIGVKISTAQTYLKGEAQLRACHAVTPEFQRRQRPRRTATWHVSQSSFGAFWMVRPAKGGAAAVGSEKLGGPGQAAAPVRVFCSRRCGRAASTAARKSSAGLGLPTTRSSRACSARSARSPSKVHRWSIAHRVLRAGGGGEGDPRRPPTD
jgi:hypothetical protein